MPPDGDAASERARASRALRAACCHRPDLSHREGSRLRLRKRSSRHKWRTRGALPDGPRALESGREDPRSRSSLRLLRPGHRGRQWRDRFHPDGRGLRLRAHARSTRSQGPTRQAAASSQPFEPDGRPDAAGSRPRDRGAVAFREPHRAFRRDLREADVRRRSPLRRRRAKECASVRSRSRESRKPTR